VLGYWVGAAVPAPAGALAGLAGGVCAGAPEVAPPEVLAAEPPAPEVLGAVEPASAPSSACNQDSSCCSLPSTDWTAAMPEAVEPPALAPVVPAAPVPVAPVVLALVPVAPVVPVLPGVPALVVLVPVPELAAPPLELLDAALIPNSDFSQDRKVSNGSELDPEPADAAGAAPPALPVLAPLVLAPPEPAAEPPELPAPEL
jgi:hypothetical protein